MYDSRSESITKNMYPFFFFFVWYKCVCNTLRTEKIHAQKMVHTQSFSMRLTCIQHDIRLPFMYVQRAYKASHLYVQNFIHIRATVLWKKGKLHRIPHSQWKIRSRFIFSSSFIQSMYLCVFLSIWLILLICYTNTRLRMLSSFPFHVSHSE